MPIPMRVTTFNKKVFNRFSSKFAGRIPPFSMLHHVGRKSGKPYSTPIMVFRRNGGFVIVMTYGVETEWAKNVLAAGGCSIEYRREHFELTDPKLTTVAAVASSLPLPVRGILKLLTVRDAMTLVPI